MAAPGPWAKARLALPGRSIVAGAATLVPGAVVFAVFAQKPFDAGDDGLFTGAVVVVLLATAMVLPTRPALMATTALVAFWLLGYADYSLVPDWIEIPVPVNEAVGGAAFFTSSYVDQQLAGALLVAAAFGAFAVAALLGRRRSPAGVEDGPAGAPHLVAEATPIWRRTRVVFIAAVVLVCLTLLPDLHKALIDTTQGALPGGWDQANLQAWEAFQQRGLTPMQDFWYPYGAMWLTTDFPAGPVVVWLYQAGVLAAMAWALWRLAGPRPLRITLCLLAVVAIGGFDPADSLRLPFVWRYLPALAVAGCYAAVGPLRHLRPTRAHLVFAVVCAGVGAMEADILLAGLGGAAFVGLAELAFAPALRAWRSLRALAVDLLPVAAALGVVLAFWALAGILEENVRWFLSFRAVSAASAAYQEQFGALLGLTASPTHLGVVATIPALVIVLAYFQRRYGGASGAAASRVLVASGGVATVMLAKHLVRPQGWLVAIVPLVALVWTVILRWEASSLRSALAAGAAAGAVLGFVQASATETPSHYLAYALATPARAVRDVGLLFDDQKLRAAERARFAAKRFEAIPEKTVIADKLEPLLTGTGDSRFATLGDAQILYILFNQRPPGHISLYDTSPIAEQRRWVDGVRAMRTRLLVWRRDLAIDGVPYQVRAPLVFSHAVANYVPQVQDEPMDLLRRRRAGEDPAEEYWRGRLGTTADLGGIPSYSNGDEHPSCTAGPGCVPYAIVTGKPIAAETKVTVYVAGTPYAVQLTSREGVTSYAIRLDRLWFWPFVRGARSLTVSEPGWQVERSMVKAGDDLY